MKPLKDEPIEDELLESLEALASHAEKTGFKSTAAPLVASLCRTTASHYKLAKAMQRKAYQDAKEAREQTALACYSVDRAKSARAYYLQKASDTRFDCIFYHVVGLGFTVAAMVKIVWGLM